MNEIADEFDQQRLSTRRTTHRAEDVSLREDASDEATERRRRARREIMERGLSMDQKRREAHKHKANESTFDEMVDDKGKLREKSEYAVATAMEDPTADQTLRNRSTNTNAVTRGSVVANPFDDEMGGVINEKAQMEEEQISHEPRTTSVLEEPLRVVTALAPAIALPNGPETPHLTPTTSLAPSTLTSATGLMTPTSEDRSLLSSHDYSESHSQPVPTQSYQSIQEWASTASSGPESFYSPPESERNYQNFQNVNSNVIHTPSGASSKTVSVIGTNEGNSEGGDLGVEALSDSGIDTPFTWSEVGSQVSGDD